MELTVPKSEANAGIDSHAADCWKRIGAEAIEDVVKAWLTSPTEEVVVVAEVADAIVAVAETTGIDLRGDGEENELYQNGCHEETLEQNTRTH